MAQTSCEICGIFPYCDGSHVGEHPGERIRVIGCRHGDGVGADGAINVLSAVVTTKGDRGHVDRFGELEHNERVGFRGTADPTVEVVVLAIIDVLSEM